MIRKFIVNLKTYRIILLLRASSLFGDILFSLGFPLLILKNTNSASQFSLSFAFDLSLYMIFTLIGGYISDYLPLRKVLYCIDFILFFIMLIFAAYFYNHFNLYIAYICIVILAIFRALYNMSFDKIPILYLKGSQLNKALAYYQSMQSLSQVIALPIVGLLLAYMDYIYIFWINGITFFISGVYFYVVKSLYKQVIPKTTKQALKNFKQSIVSGFTIIFKNSSLKHLTILAIVMNVILSSYSANWALLYKVHYQINEKFMGLLHAISALFFVISSIVLGKTLKNNTQSYKKPVIYAQYLIILGAFIIYIYQSVYGVLLASILFSVGGAMHAIPSILIRKNISGINSYGSVLAAARVLSRLFSPLTMFLTAIFIQYIPIQTIFLIFSIVCLVLSIIPSLKLYKT